MFIKLLCTKTTSFNNLYGEVHFAIEEGTTVNALIDERGVHFEYEPHHYSLPYRFEDMAKCFISAFDEDAYNNIYQKASNCKMYFEDGTALDLGGVVIRRQND